MPLHVETPLIESHRLGRLSGRSVWLKLESLQPSGSFKIRGVGLACETRHAAGAKRFVCSSGGNAGLAVAYAGRRLATPVVVVVPETSSGRVVSLLRDEGADVQVHGASWQEANEAALSLVGPSDAFIHPFDDALLWQGHSTVVDEVVRSGLRPDAVVVCVGGGGLLCGVAAGLQRHGLSQVPIIAVETYGAASLHESMRAGHRVTLDRIDTVATSLGARQVCERAFEWSRERPIQSVLVSDRSAARACEQFADDHRILVEPACGAGLALVYDDISRLDSWETVLFVVCGGSTATIDQIHRWAADDAKGVKRPEETR